MGDHVIDEDVAEVVRRARQASGEAGDKTVHFIKECPAHRRCAGKHGIFWSFDTPSGALEKLKSHLMKHYFHKLDEANADALIATVTIESYIDSGGQGQGAGVPKPPNCPPPPLPRSRSRSRSGDKRRASHWRGNSHRVSAGGRSAHISVPSGTATLLNEALVRAVESFKQMRLALYNYERAAKESEVHIQRAQTLTTQLLKLRCAAMRGRCGAPPCEDEITMLSDISDENKQTAPRVTPTAAPMQRVECVNLSPRHFPHGEAGDAIKYIPVGKGCLAARGRPTVDDLSAWKPHLLVTLSQSYEDGKRIRKIQDRVDQCSGMQWLHLHMNQLSSKANSTLSEADEQSLLKVDLVLQRLRSGDRVVVHCHAGLHRTGLFIYILLRRHGFAPGEALEALRTTRRRAYDEMTWRKGNRSTLADKAETAFHAVVCEHV